MVSIEAKRQRTNTRDCVLEVRGVLIEAGIIDANSRRAVFFRNDCNWTSVFRSSVTYSAPGFKIVEVVVNDLLMGD